MTVLSAVAPRRSLFDALANLADEARVSKTAGTKRGDEVDSGAPSGEKDPGGYQGESTHPTADATNNTEEAKDGARAQENERDVKEDYPPAVDAATPNKPDSDVQEQDQLQIGTTKSGPGGDPSVEDDYKDRLTDPGTTHPAKADIGDKYSSCSFKDARAHVGALSNDILADLANGFGDRLDAIAKQAAAAAKTAPAPANVPLNTKLAAAAAAVKQGQAAPPAATPPATTPAPGSEKTAATTPPAAAPQMSKEAADALAAGYELARNLGIDKTAMDRGAYEAIESVVRDALLDAELVGTFYKQAVGPADEGAEDHDAPSDSESGAGPANSGGGPPSPDMAGGGTPETPPPPGPPAGGPGASGPLSPMGDLGGGGGMPGGAGGPGGPGGGGEEQALQELAMALEELGVPLDRLAAMSSHGGSGMPPGEPAKIAAEVTRFKQSGRFQHKQAATVYERQLRDHFKTQLRLLLGWS